MSTGPFFCDKQVEPGGWGTITCGDHMPSLIAIIYFIPIIITLQAGVFIYFAGRQNYLNRVFFLLSVLIVLWNIEGLAVGLAAPWRNLITLGGLLLPVAFLQFSFGLLRYSTSRTRAIVFIGYFWAGLLFITGISPLTLLRDYFQSGFSGSNSTAIFLYLAYFISYTLVAEILLLQAVWQKRGDPNAVRYLLVAVAALAAIIGGILQAGLVSSPIRCWLCSLINLAYVLVMGWAIWRYEVLEVSPRLRITNVYSIVITLVLLVYLVIVQLLSALLPFPQLNPMWMGLLATLIVGPLFYPLRVMLANIVKKYFPLTQDIYYDKMRTFSQELANLVPLEDVATKILTFISEVFDVRHAELVVGGSNGVLHCWRLSREKELKIVAGSFDYPGVCLYGMEQVITVPIGSREKTVGWLKLGESGRGPLSKDDCDLLRSFLGQAGTALHNALLFSELTGLIRHYEALLAGTINGVMVLDERLRIITINPVAARMFGVDAEEAVHRHLAELPGAQILEQLIDRLKQGDQPAPNTEGYIGPVDAKVPVQINVFAFSENEDTDTPPSIIIVMADLTERKETEKHLRRTERLAAMGRLTTGLAHELRNGLNKIGGFAAILEDLTAEQPDLAYYAKGIQEDVRDLADFLNKFLAFARERDYNLARVKLVDILQRDLATLQRELTETRVKLVEEYQSEAEVLGDRHLLGLAFFNLLINAIQALAGREGGVITVRVYERGSSCFVEIEDNGPGIPAVKQELIFDPFYTTKESGTGLGLPTAYKVVTGHNGKLSLKSEVGEGTLFTIELPKYTENTPDSFIRSEAVTDEDTGGYS